MSSFTKPLQVEAISDGTWKIISPFEYHIGSKESNNIITILAGFKTDFASVPKLFWNIFPPYGRTYGKAAVIHDALYTCKKTTRKKADQIFLEGMKVLKASIFTRYTMYAAVRLFAWTVWNKRKASDLFIRYELTRLDK